MLSVRVISNRLMLMLLVRVMWWILVLGVFLMKVIMIKEMVVMKLVIRLSVW